MTSSDMTPNAPISPTAADDVGVAHARWWDALRREDVAVLDTLLADDLTFHGPSGGVTTKAKYLESLRSGRRAYDSIIAEEPLNRVHGATAIVTGRADILLQSEGRPKTEGLYYAAVYVWTAPHGRMLAWQSTVRADARA
jgi:ketosteroid isomerase-like protein